MPTLRRSKPVRRIRQHPLPDAVQLAPPTDVGFSYRSGRDLAETRTNNGNADKAGESKPAHDKFPGWRHSKIPLKGSCMRVHRVETEIGRPVGYYNKVAVRT